MRQRLVGRATAVLASSLAIAVLEMPAYADIYIPRGSYPAGTEATPVLQGNDYMPQGGDLFLLQSTDDPNLENYVMQSGGGNNDEDWFKWFFDGRILKDSAGNVLGSGGIFAVDHVHTTPSPNNPTGYLDHDNGYQFIDPNQAQAWIQALKGNWDYVSKRLESATFVDKQNPSITMTWDDLVEIGFDCGAAGVQDGKNGTWFDSTIYVSDPATGRLCLSQHSVQQGQHLTVTTTARIGAYHATGYHLEALQILDPSGQDITASLLGPYGSERISGAAPTSHELYANGLLMTAVSGGGPATVPGGPQTWTHTATIDTTNLQPGTYTVNYWVRDWFDRGTPENSPIHDTFTVTPSGNGGGGNNGGGQSGGGSGGGSGSGGSGGGGQCQAPYDSDVQWVNLGNGDQRLVWTHH